LAFLFDTDAISELLRPRPAAAYLEWLTNVSRKVYGRIRARLEENRAILPDADLQIAATALYHGLELVTGNLRHFQRINGLEVNAVLANSRRTE
jgi:predicted nucleic acid-binding protein